MNNVYTLLFFIYLSMKTSVLTIRINKDQKERLVKTAQNSKRNMSDYLRLLLEYAIENNIKL